MRLQPWCAPLLSLLLASTTSTVLKAQYDLPPGSASGIQQAAYVGGVNSDPFGPGAVQPAAYPQPIAGPQVAPTSYPPGAYPPGAYGPAPVQPFPPAYSAMQVGDTIYQHNLLPHPAISPFDHQFSQHYLDGNGLWMHDFNSRGDQFFISAELLRTRFRGPDATRIGHPDVPEFQFFQGEDPPPQDQGFAPFEAKLADEVYDQGPTTGIRLKAGILKPDDSGFDANMWWASEYKYEVIYGLPNANPNEPTTLLVSNPGIPFWDGTFGSGITPGDDYPGAVFPTDMKSAYKFSQEAWGGEADFYSTPMVDRGPLKVRGILGARYVGVREDFGWFGADSGGSYTVEFPPGTFPDPDSFVPGTPVIAEVNSEVRSHLFGPETGLRFDLGGDHFKIWGSCRLGIAANTEELNLFGYGLGDSFDPAYDQNRQFFASETHTHLSPFTEQQLQAEINALGLVPVVNRMRMFDNAKFRVGYSALSIFELARPWDIIVWQGQPLDPEINTVRSRWYMGTWNFALDWQF